MKRALLLVVPVIAGLSAFAQLETGISYDLAIPQKELADNINLTHSVFIDVFYRFRKVPQLRTGIQFGGGTYANKKENQHYVFRDGSSTDVEVSFSSNIVNGHITAAYELLTNTAIIPYVTAKGGYSKFYTKIYIPDPDDAGSCRPLENRNVFKDATWSAGWGAGARMKINRIFRKSSCDRIWVDLSADYLTGGKVDYLNVKNLQHHEDEDPNAKDYNVRFVNISSRELHEHHVSKVFSSRINQLHMKLGIVLRLK
jgi:hypothetical protein